MMLGDASSESNRYQELLILLMAKAWLMFLPMKEWVKCLAASVLRAWSLLSNVPWITPILR
eukprot:14331-Pelagomonas_calceolata.AAC.1